MALIKCPECEGYVSDLSVSCIHCGFPISSLGQKKEDNMCVIDGTAYNLTFIKDELKLNPNDRVHLHDIKRDRVAMILVDHSCQRQVRCGLSHS